MASFTPPSIGQPNSTEDSKIVTALTTLDNLLDSSDLVPNAGLAGGITDDKLASPNNSVYRTVFHADGVIGADSTADTYLLGSYGSSLSGNMLDSGDACVFGGSATSIPPGVFYFDDADYTVAGKTTKLRLRAQVLTNGTAPAITFTFGLYPVTVAGGADAIIFTAGTVVTGSTVAIATPSASSATQGTSGDLTIPSDGAYLLGVATSGTIANNAAVSAHAQLQFRHV